MMPDDTLPAAPYPGLRAFSRDEAAIFFGRDGCIDEMVETLAKSRFLSVLGSSGSGKSSLVRTGLVDALMLGIHPEGHGDWTVADFNPGTDPFEALAGALIKTADPDGDITALAIMLQRGPRALIRWWQSRRTQPGAQLLLFIDQFEELFRYHDLAGREMMERFVAMLRVAVAQPGNGIHGVLTMRSERLGAATTLDGLPALINSGLFLVPRMTRAECCEAIEQPAAVFGIDIKPELVNHLLNDLTRFAPWSRGAGDNPIVALSRRTDQLPLMQHALRWMWEQAREAGEPDQLTLATYRDIRKVAGALDEHGEKILDSLGKEGSALAQTAFTALTDGDSLESAVRRPATLGELAALADVPPGRMAEVVDAFRQPAVCFLRTDSEPIDETTTIDITHESLIRQWGRLAGWFDDHCEQVEGWRDLVAAHARYAAGRGDLPRGLELQTYEHYWKTHRPTALWAERQQGDFDAIEAFLDESIAARDANKVYKRRRSRYRKGGAALATFLIAGGLAFGWEREKHKNAQIDAVLDASSQGVVAMLDIAKDASEVGLLGFSPYERRFAEVAGDLVDDLSGKAVITPLDMQMASSHVSGEAFVRAGRTMEALGGLKRAYEAGLALADTGPLSPVQAALFADAALSYGWALIDMRAMKKADEVVLQSEAVLSRTPSRLDTALHESRASYQTLRMFYYAAKPGKDARREEEKSASRAYTMRRDLHEEDRTDTKALIERLKATINYAASVPQPRRRTALYDEGCAFVNNALATLPPYTALVGPMIHCAQIKGAEAMREMRWRIDEMRTVDPVNEDLRIASMRLDSIALNDLLLSQLEERQVHAKAVLDILEDIMGSGESLPVQNWALETAFDVLDDYLRGIDGPTDERRRIASAVETALENYPDAPVYLHIAALNALALEADGVRSAQIINRLSKLDAMQKRESGDRACARLDAETATSMPSISAWCGSR